MPIRSARADGERLQWFFSTGDQFVVQITQRTTTEAVVDEKPVAAHLLMAMQLDWRVDEVDADGTAIVSQQFTRFIIHWNSPDGTNGSFDSEKKAGDGDETVDIAADLRPLLGSRFRVVITAQGQIVGLRIPAETDSLLRGTEAVTRWKDLLTKDGLDTTLRRCLGVMRTDPVEVGDTWTDERTTDSPIGKVHQQTVFRFAGMFPYRERPTAKIAMEATIRVDQPDQGVFEKQRTERPKITGTYLFDAQAGHLVRAEVKQRLITDASLLDKPVQVRSASSLVTRIRKLDKEP